MNILNRWPALRVLVDKWPAMRVLINNPDFARYAFARLFATLSWQMLDVVLQYQVWKLTNSKLGIGLIGLSQFLPFVLLLLPGGQIADRFDRKFIIACAYSVELLGAALLLVFTIQGGTNVTLCYGVAVLLGLARAFWAPAGQAMTPNLVPKTELSAAISVNTICFLIGTILGPLIGGPLINLGFARCYEVIIGLLVVTLLLITGVRPVRAQASTEWRWHQLLDGVKFVWQKKPVLGAISLDLFAVLFGGAVALIPVFKDQVLHVGAFGFGWLRAAPSIGAAVVALMLGLRPITRHAGRWMFGGVTVFGVATLVFALSTNYALSLLALAFVGAGDMVSVFVRGLLVQLETPDAIRGRVSAVNSMFIGASNELGAFESGVMAEWLGTIRSVIFGAMGTLLVVGTYMRLFPALRKLDRFPEASH